MKLLVIEDNQRVFRDLQSYLQIRYPEAVLVSTPGERSVIELLETEAPDLVFVDSSLHDEDITILLREIREFSDVPIIIFCDTETDMDRARYLEAGADQCVTKSFEPIELLAKVRALLRRTKGIGFKRERFVSFGGELTINFRTNEVFLSGKLVKLTPTEYKLLSELVKNQGRVLTHSALLDKVWGSEYGVDSSFVKKYIYRLRSKLKSNGNMSQIILNERGVGYRFVGPT